MYVIRSWLPSVFSTHYAAFLLTWALFPIVSLYKVFRDCREMLTLPNKLISNVLNILYICHGEKEFHQQAVQS